jgi:hypothetical protein
MKSESIRLGASFVEVLCDTCPSRMGATILHYTHKGYESQGAEPVTERELKKATKIGIEHEKNTHHEVRMIEGQLEGRVY